MGEVQRKSASEREGLDRSAKWWRMWSVGRDASPKLAGTLVVIWLAVSIFVALPVAFASSGPEGGSPETWSWVEAEYPYEDAGPAASSGPEGGSPETWSWVEAEYPYGDGAVASSGSNGAVFQDDPIRGASSLAGAMLIAGLADSGATGASAGIAADPAGNAWSLAEAEFIVANCDQDALAAAADRLRGGLCSADTGLAMP